MSKSMEKFKNVGTYYSLKYSRTVVNYAISEIETMMSDKGIDYNSTDAQLDFVTRHLNDRLLQHVSSSIHMPHIATSLK